MDPEHSDTSLAELARLVRAHLEWEEELGGGGLPAVAIDARARASHPEASVGVAGAQDVERPAVERGERDGEALERAGVDPEASPREPIAARAGTVRDVARLVVLAEEAAACDRCRLHAGRTKSVFARGSAAAELVFVGEGPGFNEDQQGLPFVGAAGQLLDRMIVAMGYAVDDVYICNVVKCRPPENRTPLADEAAACAPFLEEQLRIVAPRAIVALGRSATEGLGLMPQGGRNWRGILRSYQGIPVMPTYHPAFLLRSPQFKKQVWDDLKLVLAHLGRRDAGR